MTDDPSLVVPIHGGIELVVETVQLGKVARLTLDDPALDGVELGRHLLHLGDLAAVLAAELLQPGTEELDVPVGPAQHVGPGLDLLVQNRLGRPLGRDLGLGGLESGLGLVGLAVVPIALLGQVGELGLDGPAIDDGGCRHGDEEWWWLGYSDAQGQPLWRLEMASALLSDEIVKQVDRVSQVTQNGEFGIADKASEAKKMRRFAGRMRECRMPMAHKP